MDRLKDAFAKGKTLITFFTCGDPDLATTASAVRAAVENGADAIGLNIPFSDPTAGGPESRKANERAFASGTTTDKIFTLIKELRADISVPIIIMAYCNSVFSYGSEKFISACRKAGADAIVPTDLPYEEKEEFAPYCKKYGLALISLIVCAAPDRMEKIARDAEGFLYFVPGAAAAVNPDILRAEAEKVMRAVRKNTVVPCAVFGAGKTVRALSGSMFDGIIADFEISAVIEKYGVNSPGYVGEFVRTVKSEIN